MDTETMLMIIVSIVCAVGLPVVTAWVIFVQLLKGRHAERMEMIKSGVVLEEPEKKPNRYPALRNGIFMIGLALGIIIAIWMGPVMNVGDWFDMTIPTMAVLWWNSFCGLFLPGPLYSEKGRGSGKIGSRTL